MYSEVFSHVEGLAVNGGTTGAFDSTGSAFLAVGVAWFGSNPLTVTDSAGNTWQQGSVQTGSNKFRWHWTLSPLTSAAHTVTVNGTTSYSSMIAVGFQAVAAHDGDNVKATTSGNNESAAMTPGVDGCLILSGYYTASVVTNVTVQSPYTFIDNVANQSGVHVGVGASWYEQPSAAHTGARYSIATEGSTISAWQPGAPGPSFNPAWGARSNQIIDASIPWEGRQR